MLGSAEPGRVSPNVCSGGETRASAPHWRSASLWEQVHPLHIDPDATWAPFAFELPESLPPAVEAATIAWRYELFARRNVPHWFKETAAVTPLLYEHAASPS